MLNECLTFCSMYFSTVETRFNRKDWNYADMDDRSCRFSVFTQTVRPLGVGRGEDLNIKEFLTTQWYVLNNYSEISQHIE